MEETLDTKGQFDTSLPDGEREWRIEGITRREKGATVLYIWKLSFDGEGEREYGEQVLLPSMMGGLLEVLGCERVPGTQKFKWDRDNQTGKMFIATVTHEPDKKRPEVIRQQMTGFKKSEKEDEIPF